MSLIKGLLVVVLLVCVFIFPILGDEKNFPQGNKNRRSPNMTNSGAKLIKKKVVEEFVPPPPPDFIDLATKPTSTLHKNQAFIDACKFFAG